MIEKIKELRSKGLYWHKIDTELGFKSGTSWAIAKRSGLIPSKPKWGKHEDEFLARNRQALGLKKVSIELGFSYDYVKKKSAALSKNIGKMGIVTDYELSIEENEYINTGQLYFDFKK